MAPAGCHGGRLMSRKGRTCCPARKSAKNQKVEQRISSDSFSFLSCVTHSLSFPFTLLFRSRPFSPSYVPALFHFPTLCELLRTRHVFNELCKWQVDLIRFASQYLRRFFNFAYMSAHTIVCRILFYFFFSFSPFFFYLFCFSFLPYYAFDRVRYAHLTGPAIIFLVPALAPPSRSSYLCDLVPSVLSSGPSSISSSEVRCASLRIVMPPHYEQ